MRSVSPPPGFSASSVTSRPFLIPLPPTISPRPGAPGTWTYTAYASNAESITASLDQRPTYDYPPQNFVYSVAVLDYVTGLGALGPAGLTSRIPFSSATVVAASIEAPASVFQLGINAVAFPRPLVGIAVGAFNKYQGDFNTAWPTLLMTLDGADSWLAVTGLPVQLQDAQTLVLGVAAATGAGFGWGDGRVPWPARRLPRTARPSKPARHAAAARR